MSAPSFTSFPDLFPDSQSTSIKSRSKHKRKHRDDTSFREKDQEPSTFYYVDRSPDNLNIQYGRLPHGDVPKYAVVNHGRKILGLPATYTAFARNDQGIQVGTHRDSRAIFNDRSKTRKRLSRPPRRMLKANSNSTKYQETEGFLPLPSHRGHEHRGSVVDSDPESDSVTSDPGSSDDGHSHTTAHQETLKRLEQQISADPSCISNWLSLLSQSLSTVDINSKNAGKARSEIALSILSRAFSAHHANPTSPLLRIKFLEAGAKVWDDRKYHSEWEKAIEFGNIDIWMEWFERRIREAKTADGLSQVVGAALRILSSLGDSEQSEIGKVRVFWRTAIALQQAGYYERATAMFQAQAELTFEVPQALSGLSLDSRLEAFEEFWDSEAPRMGESESKGWAQWTSRRQDFISNGRSILIPKSTELDPYRQWAEYEILADRGERLPSRSTSGGADNDPYAIVLFTDIRPLLFDLRSDSAKRVFRLAWLSALGLHLPGFATSLSEHNRDDRWSYIHLTKPAFLDALFPVTTQQAHLTADAFAGTLIGRQKVHGKSFGPVKNWSWSSLRFFDPLFASTGMWNKVDIAEVDTDFVSRVFSSLRFGVGDVEWDFLSLTFEAAVNIKSALKLSRSYLSTARDSLLHWAAHAQMERIRGKLDEARKVYQTVLVTSMRSVPRPEESLLWWDWAEMEWLAGQAEDAQSVILRAARVEGRGGVAILRARRTLHDWSKDSISWQSKEAWIKLAALSNLLASHDVRTALSIFEEQLAKIIPTDTAHESLTMSLLLLLHRYSSILKHPIPPSMLRERVIEAMVHYPYNSVILGLFLEVERGQGVWGRIRATLGDNGEHKEVARRVQEVWIAGWESGRWESEIERTRIGLNGAIGHERTKDSSLIWRIYIEFEIRVKRYDKAKELLWRALGLFPLYKDLYLLAFGPLRSVFQNRELNALADGMAERGIRMRRGLDEVLEEWVPKTEELNDDLDNKEEDEIEYNAKELRRLQPF